MGAEAGTDGGNAQAVRARQRCRTQVARRDGSSAKSVRAGAPGGRDGRWKKKFQNA